MLPLAIVLALKERGDTFTAASLVIAVLGVGVAASGPIMGRAADVFDTTRVVLAGGILHAAALAALVAVIACTAQVAIVVGAAVVVAATTPPIAATTRAAWPRFFESRDLRDAAYALEAMTLDIVYIAAQLCVAVIAIVEPIAAVALAVPLLLVTAFIVASSLPPVTRVATRRVPLRLVPPKIAGLLSLSVLVRGAMVTAELATIALCVQTGRAALAGALLGLVAFGSIMGAFFSEEIAWLGRGLRAITCLTALLSVTLGVLALIDAFALVACLLAVGGIMLGALFAHIFVCVADRAPADRSVESFGWFNAAGSLGAAFSLIVAGSLIDARGASAGFTVAAALAFAGAIAAYSLQTSSSS